MKYSTQIFAAIGGGVLLISSVTAQAQILGSQHDMSAPASQVGGGGTDEVCVFCHTPHGSDTAAAVPLWNRFLDTSVVYQRYSELNTATLDGEEVPVGSVSLACLSCHDGQQAMDAVINAPGSGGYNALGAPIDGGAGVFMANAGTDPIPALGTDLRDDHPISIQYAGGACNASVTPTCDPGAAASGDPDFNVIQYAAINTQPNYWVDTTAAGGTPGVRDKTDMILYTRAFTGGAGPAVECGSCHDPHNSSTFDPGPGAPSVAFLRILNSGSDVCLACHDK